MVELTYVGARILFTNRSAENGLGRLKVEGNRLIFVYKGYPVEADINTYFTSGGLSEDKTHLEEVIAPVVKQVTSDLDTIVEQLSALHTLANSDHLINSLTYDRTPDGKLFTVYDGSTLQDTRWTLFHGVMHFKGANQLIVDKKLHEWIEMAEYVKFGDFDREHGHISPIYVEGSTLREAVDRALQIYSAKNILAKFLR